jgi:hypothetical protein
MNSKISGLLTISIILIMLSITAGCVAGDSITNIYTDPEPTYATPYPTAVPVKYVTPYPTAIPTKYATPVPVPTLKTTVIQSTGNSNWESYTNYPDGFKIYKPDNWQIKTLKARDVLSTTTITLLDDIVYVYAPNYNGFIMIYGMDAAGTAASMTGRTQISENFYTGFISGLSQSTTPSGGYTTNVVRDETIYTINGNPARHATMTAYIDGQQLKSDVYLISFNNNYYAVVYMGTAGATQQDATTGSNIMRTFDES